MLVSLPDPDHTELISKVLMHSIQILYIEIQEFTCTLRRKYDCLIREYTKTYFVEVIVSPSVYTQNDLIVHHKT